MPVNVLIVDDSAVVRKVLSEILNTDKEITVYDTAQDPIFAERKMNSKWPDVIVLDVEMPRMDGITFLKKIMSTRPTPVVICSSVTEKGAQKTLEALSAGAVTVIEKPKLGLKGFLTESAEMLIDAVKGASKAQLKTKLNIQRDEEQTTVIEKRVPKVSVASGPSSKVFLKDPLIVIGASTGGTQAIEYILRRMPENCPPILIVQHMPEHFTKAFADRLNIFCAIEVKEAENHDQIKAGRALIAPGDFQMYWGGTNSTMRVRVEKAERVNRHRPSVDALFLSIPPNIAQNVIAVLLTGMGNDGALGLTELKKAGSFTIAQNEESCVVYGMPMEAVKMGGATEILHLYDIPDTVIRISGKK